MQQCIAFCRTNLDCSSLEKYLIAASGGKAFRGPAEKGAEGRYSCAVVGGRRSTQERKQALDAFRSGDVRVLICTDAAARGIDVKELPFMVNMTLPDEPENYIHRIGRVGRADKMGLAISLVSVGPAEKVWFFKDRKEDYNNTKLWHLGGGAIWYDEARCLRAIERRIAKGAAEDEDEDKEQDGAHASAATASLRASSGSETQTPHPPPPVPIPRMTVRPNGRHEHAKATVFSAYKFQPPNHVLSVGQYGEDKAAADGPSDRVLSIQGQVQLLAGLEVQSQLAYLALSLFKPMGASMPDELVSDGRQVVVGREGAGDEGAGGISFGMISSRRGR